MNSFEEIYFPFDEAVLTSKIEFTVLDVVSGGSTIYYWKLRLFGCREFNGIIHPILFFLQFNCILRAFNY